jgi:cellulose synthase/poly-beta-1,6-N-acetylglucosamine synthase-like glycosyltransferase
VNWIALLRQLFVRVETSVIVYVMAINVTSFVLTVTGYFALRNRGSRIGQADVEALLNSPLVPGITVVAPAHNEEPIVRDSVQSMLGLRHPNHEVIVVNDGSTDGTLAALIDEFHLYRSSRSGSGDLPSALVRGVYESRDPIHLLVVDKVNSGKADSLNAGINYARLPLIASVDSDSLLERDALLYLEQPFLEDPVRTVAAGGIIHVINGCDIGNGVIRSVSAGGSMLSRLQAVEYLRAFLGGRVAFSFLDALLLVSGAFGLFRRDAVVAAGGFDVQTVGEDMELIVRLHEKFRPNGKKPRIVFVPEPVCWTEVPESLRVLRRQRTRWQRGGTESVALHARMFCNPRFGMVGLFGIPHFVLFELLGPIVELLGYAMTILGFAWGLIAPQIALSFFVVSVLFGILLSTSAVVLEHLAAAKYPAASDILHLLGASVVENFGYRQLTAWWRLEGLIQAFRRKKDWGDMERAGFERAS